MPRRRLHRLKHGAEENHQHTLTSTTNKHASAITPSLSPGQAALLQMSAVQGNLAVQRWLAQNRPGILQRANGEENDPAMQGKEAAPLEQNATKSSFRFAGDPAMADIFAGKTTLQMWSRGMAVRKMQQALVDMGFPLAKYSVDGIFGPETEGALKAFQISAKIPDNGVFDKVSIEAMQARYDTRQPYIDQSKYDPANPGTRALSSDEAKAAHEAMVPVRGGGGGPSTFQEEIAGVKYGDAVRVALTAVINKAHHELYATKEPLRADPDKNFHAWDVLESTAKASKDVTDGVYGSYAKGPEINRANNNLIDQWEDEKLRNAALSPKEQQDKARNKVIYLINSNLTTVNAAYQAVPSDKREKEILTPIVEEFVDTPAEVQKMLEIEMGWEGAELEGTVYLQRYKKDTDEANRAQLWELFHTCIHEYLHSLTHPNFAAYAHALGAKGDSTRENTLIEGMNDFFTENVRATIKVDDKLRQQIEGPYFDPKAPIPKIDLTVYPSIQQAERVVAIIGIRNAQAAYFQGQVKFIRGKK